MRSDWQPPGFPEMITQSSQRDGGQDRYVCRRQARGDHHIRDLRGRAICPLASPSSGTMRSIPA